MRLRGVRTLVDFDLWGLPRVTNMALSDVIKNDVSSIISTTWDVRKGQKVPSTESIKLAGGAVELEATFLYADLAKSSKLTNDLDRRVASKILKSFLATTTRLIRENGGTVISFDGDRALGVFVGGSKNSDAAKCALHINWAVSKVIRTKFEATYQGVKNLGYLIAHGVGIDTGTVYIVRAGARGDNDLSSIGRAPSLAAKLSEVRESNYRTYITAGVYNKLTDASKYEGTDKQNMWKQGLYKFLGENITIYRSSWHWEP